MLCEEPHPNFFIFVDVSKQMFWLSALKDSQTWSVFVSLSVTGLNQAVPLFSLFFHQTLGPVCPASYWISSVVFLALSLQLGCSLLFFSFLIQTEVFIRGDDESGTLNGVVCVSSSRKTHSTWFVTTEKSEKIHWKHCRCSEAASESVSTHTGQRLFCFQFILHEKKDKEKTNFHSLSVISRGLLVQLFPSFLPFHCRFQNVRCRGQLQ